MASKILLYKFYHNSNIKINKMFLYILFVKYHILIGDINRNKNIFNIIKNKFIYITL